MLLVTLAAVSALAFLYYGSETLFADPPRGEFDRYGMPKMRVFVGSMQMLGAAGVALGIVVAPLGAAGGLTLMMLLGLAARYKIRDAPRLMIPAGSLAVLNATLVVLFIAQ